jgi:hypothetical protein
MRVEAPHLEADAPSCVTECRLRGGRGEAMREEPHE